VMARARTTSSIGLNLTSMIDVVFLLLIYFMVATEFRSAEASFPMDLPAEGRNAEIVLDEEPLVVIVESAGEFTHDIRIQLEGPWESVQSLVGLKKFLRTNRADGFGSGGLFTPDHPILIRPHSETRWEHAVAAYNVAVESRYTNITLGSP
jgi:biopolymer transport protein ExbD